MNKKIITIIGFFICSIHLLFSKEWVYDAEIKKALNEVNRIRKEAGLDSVILSDTLSKACYKHARYLVFNKDNSKVKGLNAHKEYKELKGYSKDGENAGKNAVIAYEFPFESVKAWEASFYHRIPLLQPNLKEIGIAYYKKEGYWPISLIECISGLRGISNTEVVCYPNNNQTSVPIKMGDEIPHPMGKYGNYGFPITIFFTKWQKITRVNVSVTDYSGKKVICNISTPEKPATEFPQWNTICVIPSNELIKGETYTVAITCMVNGEKFNKIIRFKT